MKVAVTLGLVASNFAWQAFGAGEYQVAFERSFFQVIAVILVSVFGD